VTPSPLYAGVMSGTSLDGADAAIVEFQAAGARVLAFASVAFPADLRSTLLALSDPTTDSLDAAGEAQRTLADHYAKAVQAALAKGAIDPGQVGAIGCHGQTVRHRPERGFTIQLNDPARLAELTGIDVVADLRRRDMAAGGQGAPLAPAFHDAVFRHASIGRTIVNIGGIANVTLLVPGAPCIGFDCGPGNVLLDAWAGRHLGVAFDRDGAWSATGRVLPELLARLLAEPFLGQAPPKSAGRELFNLRWLKAQVPAATRREDVQATLAEFTARAITDAIARQAPSTREIYLCGGGVRNAAIVAAIGRNAGGRRVDTTGALGVAPQEVEAAAFAWLAMKCVRREPIDLRTITGASGPRILGAIYPA
jgi:anhydro-N-acetylmuramic acid kinase